MTSRADRRESRIRAASEAFGSAVIDEAALRDAELPDTDWSAPAAGAVASIFAAPSGPLAMISLGDPANQRVLLVPGVTGSKEDFTLMMPELAAAGYFVQSYDLAGQWQSKDAGPQNLDPPAERYDYDLFVNDLIAVLESVSGASHVLGYSFAGTVSQLALVSRPQLFASLTLLSCPPRPGQGFRGIKRIGWLSGIASGRIGAGLMIWGLKRNVMKVPPGRFSFVLERFTLTRRSAVDDVVGLMKRAPDTRRQLAQTAIPKLVAVGQHDLWPLRLHSEFAKRIGARLAVYRTGHSPCETAPHQLNRDLFELFGRAR